MIELLSAIAYWIVNPEVLRPAGPYVLFLVAALVTYQAITAESVQEYLAAIKRKLSAREVRAMGFFFGALGFLMFYHYWQGISILTDAKKSAPVINTPTAQQIADEVAKRISTPNLLSQPHIHITKYIPHKPVAGTPIMTNIDWINKGSSGRAISYGSISIFEGHPKNSKEERELEELIFSSMMERNKDYAKNPTVLSMVPDGTYWSTAIGPVLTEHQVDGILSGRFRVYVTGVFSYIDNSSRANVEYCVWWNTDQRVLHVGQTHNKEE